MENIPPQLVTLLFVLLGAFLVYVKYIVLYFVHLSRRKGRLEYELNVVCRWLRFVRSSAHRNYRIIKRRQPDRLKCLVFSSSPTEALNKIINEDYVYKTVKDIDVVIALRVLHNLLRRPRLQEGFDFVSKEYRKLVDTKTLATDQALYNFCFRSARDLYIEIRSYLKNVIIMMKECKYDTTPQLMGSEDTRGRKMKAPRYSCVGSGMPNKFQLIMDWIFHFKRRLRAHKYAAKVMKE